MELILSLTESVRGGESAIPGGGCSSSSSSVPAKKIDFGAAAVASAAVSAVATAAVSAVAAAVWIPNTSS